MKKYVEEYYLPCYESDMNMIMTPYAFLDHAQEIANRSAEELGFGRNELMKNDCAWILSRMHVIFHQMPHWQDKISLKTWHKGMRSLFYMRDFSLHDYMGNLLVSATSSWLVLNLETRRISRSHELAERYAECIEEDAIEESAPKLMLPDDAKEKMELAKIHNVCYSDIDGNRHVNNVKYVVWAMDAIGMDITSKKSVKELKINFNHEIKPGDRVEIYKESRETENGLLFTVAGIVTGSTEKTPSFIAELLF